METTMTEVPLRTLMGSSQPGRNRISLTGRDDLEVGPFDAAERVQLVVRPTRVRRAGDVPARAVVGDEHPVALERDQHDTRLAKKTPHVEARLQPKAEAHRRQARVGRVACEVPCGKDVSAAGAPD